MSSFRTQEIQYMTLLSIRGRQGKAPSSVDAVQSQSSIIQMVLVLRIPVFIRAEI